ncbi:four-carbon acid sugar kinase family protein [Pseudophaeobacter profundi]|uniref:four-carbon acid sugar kinase family protein n=1 Tax=Pseudophaeobacter profundi TaxID=3034152 RepID=UPI00242A419F|nr:four-carbon acid sugar kinase family protein [Pseudophaeobacter profundi]
MGARIVFIGDDFTGASDSLASYARRGLRTRLVTGHTTPQGNLDVLGVATDLRSLSPVRALDTLRTLWPMIEAEKPEVIHLKVCSTFDSAPGVGSIGAIAREIQHLFEPETFAVIGGQPSLARYCAFGNLFAHGPGGAVHRIDRHPVMARHPVTPMNEADLGLHLAAQGLDLPVRILVSDLDESATVAERLGDGPALVDNTCALDQLHIRAALDRIPGRKLLVGASSVAEILGDQITELSPVTLPPRDGSTLIFAGSRSSVTAAQVAAATEFECVALSPDLLSEDGAAQRIARSYPKNKDLLLHLVPDADYCCEPAVLADACAAFVQDFVAARPVRALGLAGGDTSSRIVTRLGFDALDFHRDLGQGACVCIGRHGDPSQDGLPVMLKGGQMGAVGLFNDFTAQSKADLKDVSAKADKS